jgi:hypothetical protein
MIIISSNPRFMEDSRLNLPDGVLPREETIGFDPMEADQAPAPTPEPDIIPLISRTPSPAPADRQNTPATTDIQPEQAEDPYLLDDTEQERSAAPTATPEAQDIPLPDNPDTDLIEEDPTVQSDNESGGAEQQLLQEERLTHPPEDEESLPRRSDRERRPPKRYEGALAASLEEIHKPGSYNEAMADKLHRSEWLQAIKDELTQLQGLDTWELSKLPPGKKAIGSRWVFNVKLTSTGLIDRYKARLVAQGFSQVPGDDYLETFSPTIRGESLRTLLAIAAYDDLEIRQIDVVSAYPRSELHAEVYMRPPQGLKCPEGTVLRIKKSLYGLKQSGREWYIEACKGLGELGLEPLFSEPSIFATPDRKLIIGLYVDDMLILSKDPRIIENTVSHIKERWAIKDMGNAHYILGLRIHRDRKRRLLSLDQRPYIEQMLKRFKLGKARPCPTPASSRDALLRGTADEPLADQSLFQQGIGSLNWLAICSRPDISYSCNMLAQSCNRPTVRNWNGVIHLMRYISGTKDLRLWYGGYGNTEIPEPLRGLRGGFDHRLLGFCDADHAGDETDRKSVTGHLFMLNRGPITWTSSKQRCVATSTAEAEYIALAEAAKQGQWVRTLLLELRKHELLGPDRVVRTFNDNQACLTIATDPVAHRRTKHIDIRYHYSRQLIAAGKMTVSYLPTHDMLADILTKPLPLQPLKRCIRNYLIAPAN